MWCSEAREHIDVVIVAISVMVQNMMSPLRRELALKMCIGWRNSPTIRSVVDKQASAVLDLVRSCRFVITATITRMLSTMMRGQVRALTTILRMNAARRSGEMFAGFTRKTGKPQPKDMVLNVVWFIFARFWLDKASLCVCWTWIHPTKLFVVKAAWCEG